MPLACPHCRGRLDLRQQPRGCPGCGASFRALRGIADLRTAEDEYLANDEDWRIAKELDRDYDRLDFLGLLNRYYDLVGDVPDDLRARQIAHILTAPARADQWMEALGEAASDGPILDLGCGPGAFLAARAGDGRAWVGIDIAMRWLILARKRLDEAGITSVELVCGCAEALPFAEGTFAAVVGGDVIEHVRDQVATLDEVYRVLRPGGRMVLATPNRFSLAPEPHVGVWGVGFLPRRAMGFYVQMVRKMDFKAIYTLGWGEWKRMIGRSEFRSCEIVAPSLPDDGGSRLRRWLGRLYNRVVRSSPGQAAARRVGPLFHIVGERPRDPAIPGASPATRRRSMPSAAGR